MIQKTKKVSSQILPIKGLDIGTSFIYSAQKVGPEILFKSERDCFFDMPYNDFAEEILKKSKVQYILKGEKIYIFGENALKFANVFGKNTRRPLKNGVISPGEEEALPVIELITKNLLGQPRSEKEIVYYSIPGSPIDAEFDIIYHENVIRGLLQSFGYQTKSLNEGLAVIYSELAKENFTGIGISLGGGMINICLAIMAFPVFSFSVARAGDWIDEKVAEVTNETVSKITTLKEAYLNLNLAETSSDRFEQAFYIYYNYLISYLLETIKKEIESHPKPRVEKPIPIVLAGGTAKPKGFLRLFKEGLDKIKLPLEIGEVKLASHPLLSTAKGTLIAGIVERGRPT